MFSSERNFNVQFVLFCLLVISGLFLRITTSDWIVLLIMSAIVLSLEMINSAIEKTCDLISKENNPKIKNIKDISAGAVLLASLFALVIGLLTLLPYIKKLIKFS